MPCCVNVGWTKELKLEIMREELEKLAKEIERKAIHYKSKYEEVKEFGGSVVGLSKGLYKAFESDLSAIQSILNSESQGDISASTGESDILHPVVERDVTRSSTTETNEEDVNRALKNIIDCEKFYCLGKVMNEHLLENVKPCETQCVGCSKH